jgi:hypothetical protein
MSAHTVRRGLAAAALVVLWGQPRAAPAARAEVYAIVGARIVTVSGPAYDTGTLVMRDGVIEAVGPSVAVPPDARVIQAKGLVRRRAGRRFRAPACRLPLLVRAAAAARPRHRRPRPILSPRRPWP